jgi:5-enolpyruvylshikimate-3-phosphate synthase
MCPTGKTLEWEDQYAMVKAIQAHENTTAEEDEMPPQVPTAAHIAAISKLLGNPL